MSVATSATPRAGTRLWVQLAMTAWIVAAFVAMFAIGSFEPGKGADAKSGYGVILFGGYFLVCSTVARDYVLYRLKVERITRFWGEGAEGFAHGLYLVAGFLFVGVGTWLLLFSGR